MKNTNNHKYKIELDNREVLPPQRDERKEKLRMILISGVLSLILIAIILYTKANNMSDEI